MAYVIKITNKNNDPNNVSLSKLYLDSIAPSLIVNPDTPYSNYESDMALSDGSVLVPLYQRQQFVKIPVSSVLVINTENSDEAIYYAQCKVNNSAILVDPDPFGGSSGGGTLIEKTITENGTYNAIDDEADGYSTVNVDVENSYTAADNGKVVNNQALVAQTAYPTTITENDTYDTTNYNSITVNVSGGGASEDADVRFLDYDGTIVASYSASDFANLSAMPNNPTHDGLTAQGWNWSLSDAKAYVAALGYLDIGQMYIPSDGKTKLVVYSSEFGYEGSDPKQVRIGVTFEESEEPNRFIVDWGDGTEPYENQEWDDSIPPHTYISSGYYTISIEVISGYIKEVSNYTRNVKEIYFGNGVDIASIPGMLAKYVTIPNGVTDINFFENSLLRCVIVPPSVTITGSPFYSCRSLEHVSFPNVPEAFPQYSESMNLCTQLDRVIIPIGVISVYYGTFEGCYNLKCVTVPNSVESIGDGDQIFTDVYEVIDIYIDSTQGSIDGAPWGAYNANVHWLRNE